MLETPALDEGDRLGLDIHREDFASAADHLGRMNLKVT